MLLSSLETPGHVVVSFSPHTLEMRTAARLRRDAYLARLGPDLMFPDAPLEEAVARMRALQGVAIGEAVMNQTVVAGIGNVYKSESLFLALLDPWLPVEAISESSLLDYLRATQRLMLSNRGRGQRTTRRSLDGPRHWVYGRSGELCLKCAGVIQMRRQGQHGRSTYWCAACQG